MVTLALLRRGLSLALVLRRRPYRLAAEEDGRAASTAAATTTLASIEGVVGLGTSPAIVALMLAQILSATGVPILTSLCLVVIVAHTVCGSLLV